MNAWPIQSQWGIAVIASEHQAALMLQIVPESAVNIIGEPKYYDVTGDSGNIVSRGFCPTCGARLFGKPAARNGIISIVVGSLTIRAGIGPKRMFTQQALSPGII